MVEETKFVPILPTEKITVRMSEYTLTLGTRAINPETKKFIAYDLGTYKIITGKYEDDKIVIAYLKKLYPILATHKNVTILNRERRALQYEIKGIDLINKHDLTI